MLALEPLEARTLLSTINWISTSSGDWDTAINWDANRVPTSSDDVVINVPGVTITHALGVSDSVDSLTSQEALVLSGGWYLAKF
jgi:hypothetical protein